MTTHNILSPTHSDTDQLALVGGELFIFDGALGLWKPLAFPAPSATDIALISAIASDTEPTWRTLVESNNASALDFGDTATPGTAPTLARDDHAHSFPALGTTPSTQAFGDAPAGGSSGTASKDDHKHGMPAAPTALPATYRSKVERITSAWTFAADNALHLVHWNNKAYDPASLWDIVTNFNYTAPITAKYLICGCLGLVQTNTTANANSFFAGYVKVNGAIVSTLHLNQTLARTLWNDIASFAVFLDLTANDLVTIEVTASAPVSNTSNQLQPNNGANHVEIIPLAL